jgi:hypothetical protein
MEETIHINRRLIEKCLGGDMKAQFQLYKQYSQAMYNIALRFLNNKMDAEDILQESFVTAFSRLDELHNKDAFGSWLKRIVINNCISLQRKRKCGLKKLMSTSTGKRMLGRRALPSWIRPWSIRPSKSCLPRDVPYWCCVHWKGTVTRKLQKHWE